MTSSWSSTSSPSWLTTSRRWWHRLASGLVITLAIVLALELAAISSGAPALIIHQSHHDTRSYTIRRAGADTYTAGSCRRTHSGKLPYCGYHRDDCRPER